MSEWRKVNETADYVHYQRIVAPDMVSITVGAFLFLIFIVLIVTDIIKL